MLVSDFYPTDRETQSIYKYYCPICLRYFNTILVSSCCNNYICRHCIGDMARRAKTDTNYVISCSHCLNLDFKLNDVDLTEEVRVYTDTPFKYLPSHASAAKTKGYDDSEEKPLMK